MIFDLSGRSQDYNHVHRSFHSSVSTFTLKHYRNDMNVTDTWNIFRALLLSSIWGYCISGDKSNRDLKKLINNIEQ